MKHSIEAAELLLKRDAKVKPMDVHNKTLLELARNVLTNTEGVIRVLMEFAGNIS